MTDLLLPQLRESLQADPFSTRCPDWLLASYQDPEHFWLNLLQQQDHYFLTPRKSALHQGYDFFHDCIHRGKHQGLMAYQHFDRNFGWQSLDYRTLQERVDTIAILWHRDGVLPQSKLCLLLPFGALFVVALLAALKLGAVISILPTNGSAYLRRRLENLEPDFVASRLDLSVLLPDFNVAQLAVEAPGMQQNQTELPNSYTYPSQSVLALLFDPLAADSTQPIPLIADSVYLSAVRDGTLALGLQPGCKFAAPDHDLMQCQPALLLAVLMNGATYVDIHVEDLQQQPHVLRDSGVHSLGINNALRDLFIAKPHNLPESLTHWFRYLPEPTDLNEFNRMLAVNDVQVFGANLLWHAAAGGCTVFSCRRKTHIQQQALPAAGSAFALTQLSGNQEKSNLNTGLLLLTPPGGDKPYQTQTLLNQFGREYYFVAQAYPHRAGRCYPADEILAVLLRLTDLPVVMVENQPGWNEDYVFTLLVFHAGKVIDASALQAAFVAAIEDNFGAAYAPDAIHFLPLQPRKTADWVIDEGWVRRQFLSGALFVKARDPLYQNIAALRQCLGCL